MKREKTLKQDQRIFILVGLLPILALFLIFLIYPIFSAVYLSLFEWKLISAHRPFVGLKNYVTLFKHPIFRISVQRTLYFCSLYVGIGTVMCLGYALLVNSLRQPWNTIMRTIYFLPVMAVESAAALVFFWMYQPAYGVFNYLLHFVGLGPYRWITSSSQALPSIVILCMWKYVGYGMIFFLTGITGIPEVVYDAAKIDGAGSWQGFVHITLPLLKPITVFILITGIVGATQVFAPIFIMTGGGPGTSTLVLMQHIYDVGFAQFKMGLASAIALTLFGVVFIVSLLQLKYFKRGFEY